ncbi:MAG: chromosome segregation protein SMC [Lachnospiraceae bacterium]|nr:chromosome segregation protein SMC [Lachnospiraceae bacterium]
MYLKSIEIQGFKSFANKIEFKFKDGITAIVGPNGSGKSNVADAVRWVLGEQSARELRGSSMQDVIFSGTETRKSMGYAYVAITMDNSDHALTVDFDEVTVARRVYRSGESEYLMNGNACRLKDVQELFYDTGVGQEGYSIIGQGQIDKILSGKSEERRELFDEAAGIVKFKRRKAAAVRKLESEKNNLLRVTDRLDELEKQLDPLLTQSEKAKVYLQKKEDLKELDANVFLLETDKTDRELKELEEKGSIARTDLKDISEKYAEIQGAYMNMGEELKSLDEEIDKKKTDISNSTLFKGQIEGKINVLKEQIHSLKVSDEHFLRRINEVKEEIEKNKKELQKLNVRKATLDEKVSKIDGGLDEVREKIDLLSQDTNAKNEELERKKSALIDLLNGRNDIKGSIARYDTMLEQAELRKSELSQSLIRFHTGEKEIKGEIDAALKEFDEAEESLKKTEDSIAKIDEEDKKVREQLEKADSDHHSLEIIYHEKKSKLESLHNMAERYEGYGSAVKRAMEEKRREKGIEGVVADLIHVDKKYETAIETALGGNLQNIVTKDEATAKRLIEILKEEHAGRATFLPLTSIESRTLSDDTLLSETGALGSADTLVKFDKKYEKVAGSLLGNYLVVDNVDNALKIAKKYHYRIRMVTLSGEALNPGGSISGGAYKNNAGLLGRNREIEALEKDIKDTLKEVDKCLELIEDLRRKKTDNKIKRNELSEKMKELELRYNTASLSLKQLKDREKELSEGSGGILKENKAIEEQIAEIKELKEKVNKDLEDSFSKEKEISSEVDELNIALEKLNEKTEQYRSELSEEDKKSVSLRGEQNFVTEEVNRLSAALSRGESEIAINEKSMENNLSERNEKADEIRKLEEQIENFGSDNDSQNQELQQLYDRKNEMTGKRDEIFREIGQVSEKKSGIERELERLKAQKEKCERDEESFTNYMWDEYQMTRSAALELRNEEMTDLSKLRKATFAVKSAIRELGNVNVNAIEEYKTLLDRYTFEDGQRNDLLKAEEDLRQIIAELDENMRNLFSRKFEDISKQYDIVFKKLFGGGKGTLELIDPENILETDIRIIAQPPGKKLQNMMQLSGGEKALSAIALLFAIQALKPSPFCLLDEIEAALDEANVDRFASYLCNLTKHTQFIVITHRRGTMMKSDRLYGITMQEKGVSTQVNVDLEDYE